MVRANCAVLREQCEVSSGEVGPGSFPVDCLVNDEFGNLFSKSIILILFPVGVEAASAPIRWTIN